MATVNWREELEDEVDPDDELLDETPPEVIDVLGFDPLEFEPVINAADCGAGVEGSPGFQPGNTCAADGDDFPMGLVHDQRTASFNWYQSEGYDEINRALRKDNVVPGSVTETHVNAMDDAFGEEPVLEISGVAKDGKLYRGSKTARRFLDQAGVDIPESPIYTTDVIATNDKVRDSLTERVKGAKGLRFTDKAYVSTSEDRNAAFGFTSPMHVSKAKNMGAIFQITGKSKMIDIEDMTGEDIGEVEMLLDRGHTFEITDARVIVTDAGSLSLRRTGRRIPMVEFDVEIVD